MALAYSCEDERVQTREERRGDDYNVVMSLHRQPEKQKRQSIDELTGALTHASSGLFANMPCDTRVQTTEHTMMAS